MVRLSEYLLQQKHLPGQGKQWETIRWH